MSLHVWVTLLGNRKFIMLITLEKGWSLHDGTQKAQHLVWSDIECGDLVLPYTWSGNYGTLVLKFNFHIGSCLISTIFWHLKKHLKIISRVGEVSRNAKFLDIWIASGSYMMYRYQILQAQRALSFSIDSSHRSKDRQPGMALQNKLLQKTTVEVTVQVHQIREKFTMWSGQT